MASISRYFYLGLLTKLVSILLRYKNIIRLSKKTFSSYLVHIAKIKEPRPVTLFLENLLSSFFIDIYERGQEKLRAIQGQFVNEYRILPLHFSNFCIMCTFPHSLTFDEQIIPVCLGVCACVHVKYLNPLESFQLDGTQSKMLSQNGKPTESKIGHMTKYPRNYF